MKPISKYLSKNQVVIIRLTKPHPLGRLEIPNATIDSVRSDGIYIKIPFLSNDFFSGREIDILWEKANFFYCLNSLVEKFIGEESCLLLIKKGIKLDSIEKRKYIRLDKPLQLSFSIVNEDNDKSKKKTQDLFSAQTVDISGGGIKFTTPVKLKNGHLLYINLEVPIFPYVDISIKGKVVRVEGNNIGINFEQITNAEANRLIKYIFEKQST